MTKSNKMLIAGFVIGMITSALGIGWFKDTDTFSLNPTGVALNIGLVLLFSLLIKD